MERRLQFAGNPVRPVPYTHIPDDVDRAAAPFHLVLDTGEHFVKLKRQSRLIHRSGEPE